GLEGSPVSRGTWRPLRRWGLRQPGRPRRPAPIASASPAPRHPGRRRETAALLHRGVKQAHTTVRSGGWDSIRIDQRPIWGGVRKVRHAVVAYALGKLQGRLLLLGTPLGAHEPWRLQVLTRADGLLERRGVRIQR